MWLKKRPLKNYEASKYPRVSSRALCFEKIPRTEYQEEQRLIYRLSMRKKIIAEGYPIFFFRLFPLLDKKYSISPLWTRILIYIYIYISWKYNIELVSEKHGNFYRDILDHRQDWSTFHLFPKRSLFFCFEGKNFSEDIYIIHIRVTQAGHRCISNSLLPSLPSLPFFSFVSSSLRCCFAPPKWTFTWASSWRNRGRWCLRRRWWNRGRPTRSCNPRRWNSRYANACPRKRWSESRQCLDNSKRKFQKSGKYGRINIRKELNDTCYRFGAGGASLGEQFSETIGAIGLVVARRESLASQGIVTVATGEAVSVPRLVLVRYPTAGDDLKAIKISFHLFINFLSFEKEAFLFDYRFKRALCILRKGEGLDFVLHLVALNASSGKLVLVARGAIDLLLARDEALSPDRVLAHHAAEALLVPLPGLVLHLLRTCE